MTIDFTHEMDIDGLDAEKTAKRVISHAIEKAACPYECQVSVSFEDADSVHRINKEFRDIDATTDVLSFPMVEYERPGDFSFLDDADEEGLYDDCFDPESGELMLGDIVLNMERVVSQAEEYGHSTERELAFLIAHSMLHLFGYDHMTLEEAEVMEHLQEEILDDLGIRRE